jgi:hypothetical protein
VAATTASSRRRFDWFSLLPAEHQAEVAAVKAAWRSGTLPATARALAQQMVRHCQERGIRICGIDGVRAWLARD